MAGSVAVAAGETALREMPSVVQLYKHLLRTAAAVATDNQSSDFAELKKGKGAVLKAQIRLEFEKNKDLTSPDAIDAKKERALEALSNYFAFSSGLARYEYPSESKQSEPQR